MSWIRPGSPVLNLSLLRWILYSFQETALYVVICELNLFLPSLHLGIH